MGMTARTDTIPDNFTKIDLGIGELGGRSPQGGEDEPTLAPGVLQRADRGRKHGEIIMKLASSRMFVRRDVEVYALAEAMEKNPDVFAVGVVDDEEKPVGIVLKRELFDNLGRMYGRDLYKRKLVPEVMKMPRVFRDDTSIFSVADTLGEELHKATSVYYVLKDASGRYSGTFSTTDVLIHLSDITNRDIALARRIQEAIVKASTMLSGAHTVLLGTSVMAKEVGGDFYVLKRLDSRKLLIAICDVSGKGIAASLITAVLGGFFDGYTASTTMKSFVRSLNRYVYDSFNLEYFVTGILIELDEQTGEATMCDLGHSYMLVMEDGKLMRLGVGAANPPLGVAPEITAVSRAFHLKPGGLVLLFTDGAIDQTNNAGEEYSERRLWGQLKSHGALPLGEISRKLLEDLDSFRGDEPHRDDITYVIVKYEQP